MISHHLIHFQSNTNLIMEGEWSLTQRVKQMVASGLVVESPGLSAVSPCRASISSIPEGPFSARSDWYCLRDLEGVNSTS